MQKEMFSSIFDTSQLKCPCEDIPEGDWSAGKHPLNRSN